MNYKHEVIMCVVNAGFTDAVMEAAREYGARGGTVIHARGTANQDAEKLFNISIQPEKEIVMIIVEHTIRDQVLHGLYQKVGLQSAGQGIAFCLPVEEVVGLSLPTQAPVVHPDKEKIPHLDMSKEEIAEREKNFAIEQAEIAMDKEKLHAELEALRNRKD